MKNNLLAVGCAALIATLGLASAARADTPATNWYGNLHLGAGRASGSVAADGLAASGLTGSVDQSRTHSTLGLALGYQFTPNFALEGGYEDLGHYKYSAGLTAPTPDSVNGRWRADGWKLAAVGTMPISRDFSVYGKAGLMLAYTAFDGSGLVTSIDQSRRRTVPTVGAGLSYALTPQIDALAGWDHYHRVGDAATTGRGNIDAYTVGLKYKF